MSLATERQRHVAAIAAIDQPLQHQPSPSTTNQVISPATSVVFDTYSVV